MLLETIGFAVIGLVVALAAVRVLGERLPAALLVGATGPSAALVGGWVARTVFGPGHAPITLALAAVVSVVLVTLLIRPKRGHEGAGPRQHVLP
jgi:ABC-type enterochelin transport system permease subunit